MNWDKIRQKIGLGTLLKKLFRWPARWLGLDNCKPCEERRKRLDKAVPNVNPIAKK